MRVDKDELFRRSDVVTLHLVLSDRSRGTVGRDELALLGPQGYLVNTSGRPGRPRRPAGGPARGTIAGAALDVFDVEPVPTDDPLLTAPKTVLTPHLGYVTRENLAHWYTGAVTALHAFAAGAPVHVLRWAVRQLETGTTTCARPSSRAWPCSCSTGPSGATP